MEKPVINCSARKAFTKPSSNNIAHISVGDDIITNLYKNVFIHCPSIVGIPKPKIVWKLNGKVIDGIPGLYDWKNGSIQLQSVAWEHEGSFVCYQINPIGLDTCSSEVKVYGKFF